MRRATGWHAEQSARPQRKRAACGCTVVQATVVGVDDEGVTIDANHPLAGKDLTFAVELTKRIPAGELETAAFGAGCFWWAHAVCRAALLRCARTQVGKRLAGNQARMPSWAGIAS